MANIIRFDPFRDMFTLRHAMDRLFDSAFVSGFPYQTETSWNLALDVSESDDAFLVKASIAGVKPEDLDVTFAGNALTIKGETKEEKDVEDKRYHLRERRYGTFARSLTLPSSVDVDKLQANFNDGVLTLHLPKMEQAKPKRIEIQSGSKMIDAKTADIKHKN